MFTVARSNDLAGEIKNSQLTHLDKELSVLAASKLMRESGATELLVTDVTDRIFKAIGIVTANDTFTRVIATGLDPSVVTTGDITWAGTHAHLLSHQ